MTVQALWALFVWLPQLAEELGLRGDLEWHLGGHGRGDLTGWDEGVLLSHVEVKSGYARESAGAKCANGCDTYQSQFAHMGEYDGATILAITHTVRIKEVERMAAEAGVGDRTTVISFRQVADALAKVLANGAQLQRNFLATLFDVENETSSDFEGVEQ